MEWRCDALQLREALNNLIDNALRYGTPGTQITLRLHWSTPTGLPGQHPVAGTPDQAARWIELAVEDDGPGLQPEELAHVFERFWRASTLPGGCGLGLAIVQEIARRHGGDARTEALIPHGLRVSLLLPTGL